MRLIKHYFSHYGNISRASWYVLLSTFTNACGNAATIFISLYLLTQFHISNVAIGFTITLIGVGACFGSYLGGYLTDHYSPRKICIIALIVNSFSLLFFAFVTSFHIVLFLALLTGFANAAFFPANSTLLMQTTSLHEQRQISAMRYMIVNLGVGFGAVIGGFISKFSFSYLFIFNAVILLVSGLILTFLIHDMTIKQTECSIKKPTHKIFTINIKFLLLLIVIFIFNLIYSQLRASFPIYLHNFFHINAHHLGGLFLLNVIIIVLFQIPVVDAFQRFSEPLIIGVGVFLAGLGMIVLLLSHTFINAIFSTLLWTGGEILFVSLGQAYMYELASDNDKGKFTGIYQSVNYLALMIGPVAGTWIYDKNSSWVWIFCFILGCLGSLICLWLYFYTIKQANRSVH